MISVPSDDFKMYKKGDYVKFSADVCRYLEKTPEPLLDFMLCNMRNISKIEEPESASNDSSLKDAIECFVCNELCSFKRECDMSLYKPNYYMCECIAGEAWKESTQNSLYDVAARIKIQKNYGGYPVLYFSQREVY